MKVVKRLGSSGRPAWAGVLIEEFPLESYACPLRKVKEIKAKFNTTESSLSLKLKLAAHISKQSSNPTKPIGARGKTHPPKVPKLRNQYSPAQCISRKHQAHKAQTSRNQT